jgi:hypothetical protein
MTDRQASDEIEITPEMVKAGFYVMLDYESDELLSRDVVARVYLAMRRVELQSHVGSSEQTG